MSQSEAAGALDPVVFAQELIRCASVTPRDAGALDVLQARLQALGFRCHRLPFGEGEDDGEDARVDNLYARLGDSGPNFCFAGHTDVVPEGDQSAWRHDPFAGEVSDGVLHGRGAADMKAAIAAFVAGVDRFLAAREAPPAGSISLLITGDEEGPAVNGTVKVLEWLRERGEVIDHCVVGEPTNPNELGEMVKHGRRGSLTGRLTVRGQQGHVAYPHLADNPIPRTVAMVQAINGIGFNDANDHFQSSNLEFTTIDIGNAATNVIPAQARAVFNIRFNTAQDGDALCRQLEAVCAEVGGDYTLDLSVNSRPFLTPPGSFTDLVCGAAEDVLGRRPALSTTGGTSDARFIKDHCPVCEFGLISQTMHKVDEQVAVADVEALSRIYERMLERYFA